MKPRDGRINLGRSVFLTFIRTEEGDIRSGRTGDRSGESGLGGLLIVLKQTLEHGRVTTDRCQDGINEPHVHLIDRFLKCRVLTTGDPVELANVRTSTVKPLVTELRPILEVLCCRLVRLAENLGSLLRTETHELLNVLNRESRSIQLLEKFLEIHVTPLHILVRLLWDSMLRIQLVSIRNLATVCRENGQRDLEHLTDQARIRSPQVGIVPVIPLRH